MMTRKWEKIFVAVAQQLKEDIPELFFDVFDDDDAPYGYSISVLSSGPDHAPEVQKHLPHGWSFLGWKIPDQRNNMGIIVWNVPNGLEEKS